jgi:hypothetical protein
VITSLRRRFCVVAWKYDRKLVRPMSLRVSYHPFGDDLPVAHGPFCNPHERQVSQKGIVEWLRRLRVQDAPNLALAALHGNEKNGRDALAAGNGSAVWARFDEQGTFKVGILGRVYGVAANLVPPTRFGNKRPHRCRIVEKRGDARMA